MARSLQQARCVLQHACHRRIVRRDEGCEDLRHIAQTAPLIACKQLDSARFNDSWKALDLDANFEFTDLRFIETRQAFDVERGREIANLELRLLRDAVDGPDLLANDGWNGAKRDAHVSERVLGPIVVMRTSVSAFSVRLSIPSCSMIATSFCAQAKLTLCNTR